MTESNSERGNQTSAQQQEMKSAKSYLKRMSSKSGSGLESAAGGHESMSLDREKDSLDATRAMLSRLNVTKETQEQILQGAESGIKKLSNEGEAAILHRADIIGLEAIVIADGSRPVLFVQDDQIDSNAEELGDWKFSATTMSSSISEVAQSVGRITDPSAPQQLGGSCFVIAPGLVVTNRHVLQVIADEQTSNGETTWKIHDNVVVDFKSEHDREAEQDLIFAVAGVEYFGFDRIIGGIDLKNSI